MADSGVASDDAGSSPSRLQDSDQQYTTPQRSGAAGVGSAGTRRRTTLVNRGKGRCGGGTKTAGLLKRLIRRENWGVNADAFRRHSRRARYRSLRLTAECTTHDPEAADAAFKLPFMKRRDKVVEITSIGKGLFVTLTANGVAAAFSTRTGRRLCYLNISDEEVARSLFYNKWTESVIVVCVYAHNQFNSLHARSIPVESLLACHARGGYDLFAGEHLSWPGFVEFDDVNTKCLTFNARTGLYKVWDLKTYELLYSIRDTGADEVKMCPGTLLLLHAKGAVTQVKVQLLDVNTGKETQRYTHYLKRRKPLEFVELFHGHLLLKQVSHDTEIVNMSTATVTTLPKHRFPTPSAFVFLYACGRFLALRDGKVDTYNCSGKKVASFANHRLWSRKACGASVHVTAKQDTLISFCKSEAGEGSINVSDILTGDSLACIQGPSGAQLRDVTAVHYDEASHTLFAGTKRGKVAVWTSQA